MGRERFARTLIRAGNTRREAPPVPALFCCPPFEYSLNLRNFLQLLDDRAEFRGKRGFHDDMFPFPFEFEPRAVKEQPFQSEFLFEFPVEREVPVTRVPDERMSDAFEVRADLVHPPRFEIDFHKVVAIQMFLDRVMGNGGNARCRSRFHFGSGLGIRAFERRLDGAAFPFEVSLDQCEIRFLNFVFAEHSREFAERIAMEGRDEKPRGFLVETMGDCRLEIEPSVRAPLPKHFDQGFPLSGSRSRLARNSGRFVDDDEVLLFESEIQIILYETTVRESGFRTPGFFGSGFVLRLIFEAFEIFVNVDRVAFPEHLGSFRVDSVDADLLFAEDGEKRGERFVRKRLSQKTVQSHVGEVAVDDAGNHGS